MAEHTRTDTHQFCDAERYIVMDTLTGKLCRFADGHNTVGTKESALDYVKNNKMGLGDWISRTIIIKLDCIAGFEL